MGRHRASSIRLVRCTGLVLAITASTICQPLHATTADEQVALGKRIYLEGVLPSGAMLSATVQGDVALPGNRAACMSCHRRSGLGSSEGGIRVLPVAGSVLYRPGGPRYRELGPNRAQGPGIRPAYTDESLARAIRDGVDSGGRPLDPLMPRYALGNAELADLTAYLKTLSDDAAPGVTDADIHFATVVSEDVDPVARTAMIDVLEAYFRDKNAGTRLETRRAENAPWHRQWLYPAYRKWVLHVWELRGPPASWRGQMEQYYREQPVFALVSGLARGSWRPVHEFCEDMEVPCLFPNTDLPVAADGDHYSVYFSKGMILEAQALAKYLHEEPDAGDPRAIVQVYRDEDSGIVPAQVFRAAMEDRSGLRVRDRRIATDAPVTREFWRELSVQDQPSVLVVWLPASDLAGLDAVAGEESGTPAIFLSSSLLGRTPGETPAALREAIRYTYPFELPATAARHLGRTRSWLRIKGIPLSDERVQANTFAAATLVARAIKHMVMHFSREYLLEKLEHITDRALSTSVYPRLSLAPDQRFASKGCYIVRPSSEVPGEVSAVSRWLVP